MSTLDWLCLYAAVPALTIAGTLAAITTVVMLIDMRMWARSAQYRARRTAVRKAREANPYTEEWRAAQDEAHRG